MYLDLDKNKLNVEQKLSKFNRLYDYIIIGTGPAASVILNNLIRKNKKILVIERGGFKKKFTEDLYSDNLKIKNNSRCFGVGGTSNTWAHIYSFMSNNEMCNNKNVNIWPLNHKELTYWCKKVGPKYKFNTHDLKDEKIYKKKFLTRKFIELKNPLNFSKYYSNRKFDMITNCKVETLDETKKINSIFFSIKHKIYSINSKKIIICAGTLESCLLINNSVKKNKLKKLKNKRFIGRYFMEHPKCYVGEIKFPKKNLIDKFKINSRGKFNFYQGLSLFKKNKRKLNTYVRFEEINSFLRLRKKILIKIFFEMEPRYRNKVYFKNNKIHIDIKVSKNETQIANELLLGIKNFFSFKPNLEKLSFSTKDLLDASHHIGGLTYPKIVDKNLKLKGLKNIFCCSSAVFPTSGSVNPTLIICGLAERLSKYL